MAATALEERYGSRVVLAKEGTRWRMLCDCGDVRWCRRADVRAGRADRCRSCARTTHGLTRRGQVSRLFTIWRGIKHRCGDPKSNRWAYYGGRGIRLHPAWEEDFATFAAAVGEPPSASHSIDRVDVDGHYEPGNVRWATAAEQAANRRTTSGADELPEDFYADDFVDYEAAQ